MRPSVYLETTIPSYLTAWLSNDLQMAAHQQATRQWWEARRQAFELFVSQFVVYEVSAGDPDAARRRLEAVTGIPLLTPSEDVDTLADALMERVPLPPNAEADAVHIAVAAVNGMNYLLTWNCTHIANAELRPRIEKVCREFGFEPPIICTPEQLMKE